MDTTRISELASKVHELSMKIDTIQWKLEDKIRELDSKVELLKIAALTKIQAIIAAYLVFYVVVLIAASRH